MSGSPILSISHKWTTDLGTQIRTSLPRPINLYLYHSSIPLSTPKCSQYRSSSARNSSNSSYRDFLRTKTSPLLLELVKHSHTQCQPTANHPFIAYSWEEMAGTAPQIYIRKTKSKLVIKRRDQRSLIRSSAPVARAESRTRVRTKVRSLSLTG